MMNTLTYFKGDQESELAILDLVCVLRATPSSSRLHQLRPIALYFEFDHALP